MSDCWGLRGVIMWCNVDLGCSTYILGCIYLGEAGFGYMANGFLCMCRVILGRVSMLLGPSLDVAFQ